MTGNQVVNPWAYVEQIVVDMISKASGVTPETAANSIETPPDLTLGDLSSTIAFTLAKEQKKNPAGIALEILSRLTTLVVAEPIISSVMTKGPYINFFLDRGVFAETAITTVSKARNKYGNSTEYNGKRAFIEYPAVNPSKPWHIGHTRNAILGDTLSNILECVGYDVVRLDYINDLGLQIAQVVWKLKQVGEKDVKEKYDHYLGHLYVEVQKTFDASKEVEQEVRQVSRNLENLKSEDAQLSGRMVTRCIKAQYETAHRLGIFHDYQVWESAIAHSGLLEKARELMMQNKNITRLKDGDKAGCIVADLSVIDEFKDLKDPYKVLFRSDGTRTYTGADVALQLWKFGLIKDPFSYSLFETQPNGEELYRTDLKGKKINLGRFDIVLNVIGTRQAHPQKMVYTILDLMGYKKESENSHHIAYEFVGLEGEDFSGREGTWIGFSTDDVLNKAQELAEIEVSKRNPDESKDARERIANQVAVGAIRYFMLNASPERKITFRWDEALDFQGNAGPYLQYSLARAHRILEKASAESSETRKYQLMTSDAEFGLLKAISQFPEVTLDIVRSMKKDIWGTTFPSNRLTEYGYELATLFSKFYDSCPVLKADIEIKEARLALVKSFLFTMTNCLNILGIPIVERM